MQPSSSNRSDSYRIRVKETLDHNFTEWLADVTLIPQANGETLLICSFADQPALRGFLDQLWNLNITVIKVERVENEN